MGWRFFIFTDSYFSLREILTGEEVLVSAPNNIACLETNNGQSSFHVLNADISASFTNAGKISFMSAETAPILYEFLFKSTEVLPHKKSIKFCAGTSELP